MSEKYTLRPLISKDIFPMVKIISCIGTKKFAGCFSSDEAKELIAKVRGKGKLSMDDIEAVGVGIAMDMADVLLQNLPSAEKYIYQFLSGVSGMKQKEIEELDIETFIEMIMDVVKMSGFKDFFKGALRSAE